MPGPTPSPGQRNRLGLQPGSVGDPSESLRAPRPRAPGRAELTRLLGRQTGEHREIEHRCQLVEDPRGVLVVEDADDADHRAALAIRGTDAASAAAPGRLCATSRRRAGSRRPVQGAPVRRLLRPPLKFGFRDRLRRRAARPAVVPTGGAGPLQVLAARPRLPWRSCARWYSAGDPGSTPDGSAVAGLDHPAAPFRCRGAERAHAPPGRPGRAPVPCPGAGRPASRLRSRARSPPAIRCGRARSRSGRSGSEAIELVASSRPPSPASIAATSTPCTGEQEKTGRNRDLELGHHIAGLQPGVDSLRRQCRA